MLTTALRALLRKRGLGYVPSKPDDRDHIMATARFSLPEDAMDLDGFVTMERNQGATSSCTAHAADHAIQAVCGFGRGPKGKAYSLRSVADPYWNLRALAGIEDSDDGGYLRDAFKAWNQLGSPPDAVWPLRVLTINRQPGPDAYRQGISWRGLKYKRIGGTGEAFVSGIHSALVQRKAVVIGIQVDRDFMDDDGPELVPAQKRSSIVGGHALMLSGFDQGGDRTRVVNSWGNDWRDGGRAWLSRDFLEQAAEAWAVEGWA